MGCLVFAQSPLTGDGTTFLTIFEAALASLLDYSTDQRGDIGSWARMAGVKTLALLCQDSHVSQPSVLSAMQGAVKQSVEKLDAVREVAGPALLRIAATKHAPVNLELTNILRRYVGGDILDATSNPCSTSITP